MKKSKKISLLVAAGFSVLGLMLGVISLLMVGFNFAVLGTDTCETNTHEVTDGFESISIRSDTADIRILMSEDDQCRVVCQERSKVKHTVTVQNGTLVIDILDLRKWYDYIGFFFGRETVTLYLPQTEFSRLNIETDTGDIVVPKDFSYQTVSLETDTGDIDWHAAVTEAMTAETDTGNISLEGCSPHQMKLDVDTGDIKLTSVNVAGFAELQTDTGKVQLDHVSGGKLSVKTSTGGVTLKNTVFSGELSVKSSTGNVRFDCADAATITVKTSTGDVKGTLLSEKIFVTKTSTGKRDVPATTSGGICEITTDTGDIRIQLAS